MNDQVIQLIGLNKIYKMGKIEVPALTDINFTIQRGDIVAIMGPSGSGKSTLMNILGCLDRPTGGEYILDDAYVSQLTDNELARIRNQKVGFVFQSFNLLPRSTALDNVELPMSYAGVPGRTRVARAREALEAVGLNERMHHRPNELSGGQQQRVAIARALVNNPAIILADEPTGNLDSHSGKEIMDLILRLNHERGTTVILVTHDRSIGALAHRVLRLTDGYLVEDYCNDEYSTVYSGGIRQP
jgi:putative ABC transport system ATP-binding protein